jgi:hypothetical protein
MVGKMDSVQEITKFPHASLEPLILNVPTITNISSKVRSSARFVFAGLGICSLILLSTTKPILVHLTPVTLSYGYETNC